MSNRTAHHYMRAYQMAVWERVRKNFLANKDDLCMGSVKRHKRALNLINEFIDMYQNKSKNWISIMHYIENTHDGNERAHMLDDDLSEFLEENFKNGRFNNTAIFLFSDHGTRFSKERLTPQGGLEERMPFFSIYLPEWYFEKYPQKYKNLIRNSQQLTTW